jgi:iron complex transport system substrate-binding protein
MRVIKAIVVFFLATACGREIPSNQGSIKGNEVKYAKGFSIVNFKGFTVVEVYNPWSNYSLLARYAITNGNQAISDFDGEIIKLPITSGAFLSSTYLGMISVLGAQEFVCASTSANWVYDSILYMNFKKGKIANLGNDLSVDAEAIIAQAPSIVMKYIYQSADPLDKVIKAAGIPVIYNIEFMEKHPLGRAEWIKLVGLLTGRKPMADTIFNSIEINYNRYASMACSGWKKLCCPIINRCQCKLLLVCR